MKCFSCGEQVSSIRRNHRFVESGLPNVVLKDVEFERCSGCGGESLILPRLTELQRVLARAVAGRAERLTPAEIRFLRKHFGWSGVEFAASMGVTKETVSRWENGSKQMSAPAERLLRLCALAGAPIRDFSFLRSLGVEQPANRLVSLRFKDHWQLAAA